MSLLRVGHKGAAALAPGNTYAAFAAARDVGVEMVEFDVLPQNIDGTGELWLAHDYGDLASRVPHTLEEALDFLSSSEFDGLRFDVDLKLPGYEQRAVDAIKRHRLIDRVLISTMERSSLRRLRALDPNVILGRSVPRIRQDPADRPHTALLAATLLPFVRAAIPNPLAAGVARGENDAVMANWRLVTPRLVREVQQAGGQLFVWTVDDADRIAELVALGVDGVITNDPRLFTSSGDAGIEASAP